MKAAQIFGQIAVSVFLFILGAFRFYQGELLWPIVDVVVGTINFWSALALLTGEAP